MMGVEIEQPQQLKRIIPCLKEGCKQVGIKEVVEFINHYPNEGGAKLIDKRIVGIFKPLILREEWQAQLKIWFRSNPSILKELGIT